MRCNLAAPRTARLIVYTGRGGLQDFPLAEIFVVSSRHTEQFEFPCAHLVTQKKSKEITCAFFS